MRVFCFAFAPRSASPFASRRDWQRPCSRDDFSVLREDLRVRIFGGAGVVNGVVVATGTDGKTRRTIFTDVFAYRVVGARR